MSSLLAVVVATSDAAAGSLLLSKALCLTWAPVNKGKSVLGNPPTRLPTVEVAWAEAVPGVDSDGVAGLLGEPADVVLVLGCGCGSAVLHAPNAAMQSKAPAAIERVFVVDVCGVLVFAGAAGEAAGRSVMVSSLTVGAWNYHGVAMAPGAIDPQEPGGGLPAGRDFQAAPGRGETPQQHADCGILHVDMDAFFVAVEQLERPDLVGKPMIVGFPHGRSVVLSASYEARAFGVRSAMPMAAAIRLCPQAVICEPRHQRYYEVSKQLMAIFESMTDKVEPLSVDEAFLDVSGARLRLGSPLEIARLIRRRVRAELGITASVGVAASKFVAKIASTRCKPDGLLLIPAEETVAYLHTLPAQALWGVGAKTMKVLESRGIHTVEQIAKTPVALLRRMLGATGEHVHRLSWGIDPRPVTALRVDKSIGAEETFGEDTTDDVLLHRELLRLAHRTGSRLRAAGYSARTVAIKLRYEDFSTITRSRTVPVPVDSAQLMYQEAVKLLRNLGDRPMAVRLIGLRAENLESSAQAAVQLSFERSEDNWRSAEAVMDAVGHRFGAEQVVPARLLRKAPPKLTDG